MTEHDQIEGPDLFQRLLDVEIPRKETLQEIVRYLLRRKHVVVFAPKHSGVSDLKRQLSAKLLREHPDWHVREDDAKDLKEKNVLSSALRLLEELLSGVPDDKKRVITLLTSWDKLTEAEQRELGESLRGAIEKPAGARLGVIALGGREVYLEKYLTGEHSLLNRADPVFLPDLTCDDVYELMSAAKAPWGEDAAEEVWVQGGGHPWFVRELLLEGAEHQDSDWREVTRNVEIRTDWHGILSRFCAAEGDCSREVLREVVEGREGYKWAALDARSPTVRLYFEGLLQRTGEGLNATVSSRNGMVTRAVRNFLELSTVPPPPQRHADVLHLSDLHLETPEQAEVWLSQLVSDLGQELGCSKLDGVIVSGDIVNRAAESEYRVAKEFFDDLRQKLSLEQSQLVLVPGNHDVCRKRSKDAYQPKRRTDCTEEELRDCIDGGNYVEICDSERYRERFAPFAAFHQEVTGRPYPLDPNRQYTLHHLEPIGLLVLGLNSSWRLDHHFTSRAGIAPLSVAAALDELSADPRSRESLKLALWHHPLNSKHDDRITDDGFMERLAVAGFRLALHGHIHRSDNALYRYDQTAGGRNIEVISAGTFGAPVREWVPGYPLQYQLLRFRENSLTVETRRREELTGAWKPDARWTSGPGEDPKPRYEISLSRS
jgi:3',5'-cyclic AMP phosphodiesterase CpdA